MTRTRGYLAAAILGEMIQKGTETLFRARDFGFHESHEGSFAHLEEPSSFATTAEMEDALEYLVREGCIEKLDDPYTTADFVITDIGQVRFFEATQNPRSLEARYSQRGETWLREALTNIHSETSNNHAAGTSQSAGAFGGAPFGDVTVGGAVLPADEERPRAVAPEPIRHPENLIIPAANRYVSVKDNQSDFDKISEALTAIKNEFAHDHYKQLNSINVPAVIGEIEAFEVQIKSNWVSRPAAQNFLETLKYIETVCVSSSKIVIATASIIASLTAIFGFM